MTKGLRAEGSLSQPGAEDLAAVAAEMFKRLGLEEGASVGTILRHAEREYGKPITLQALPDDSLGPLTGLFRDTPDRGYISFRQSDPLSYQLHCIFHELGHAVFRHSDCELLRQGGFNLSEAGGLGPDLLNARARGLVRDPSELVAEEFAYTLMRWLLKSRLDREEDVFG